MLDNQSTVIKKLKSKYYYSEKNKIQTTATSKKNICITKYLTVKVLVLKKNQSTAISVLVKKLLRGT
jgi:hypothetical protein